MITTLMIFAMAHNEIGQRAQLSLNTLDFYYVNEIDPDLYWTASITQQLRGLSRGGRNQLHPLVQCQGWS
jgi:hypothetical protein